MPRVSFTSNRAGSTRIEMSGPVFDGRAYRASRALVKETEEQIGKEGVRIIRRELHRVLQHPTGYYESRIRSQRRLGRIYINDANVVYGPWLEGEGSRNYPVTRFKGYHTFRRMLPVINRKASVICTALLRSKYLRRMN
jgi:hypothetical protein